MPERALMQSVTAIDVAPLFVFKLDLDLRYTWVSRVPPELAPQLPADVVGYRDEELFDADVAERLVQLKEAAIDNGVSARADVLVPTPAGARYYDVTMVPARDAVGQLTGLSGVAFDVTERYETETELRRAQARLAEAEEVANIGSWEWDVEQDIIAWSPGLFRIYGITPDEFDPRFAARQREQRVHPDDRGRVERAVATALEAGNPFEMDYRILRPDGRVRLVHAHCEPVLNDVGKVVRLVGAAQDVTGIRRIADAPNEVAAEVRTALGPRQFEILELIAEGLSNHDISERLVISDTTVKWHVRQILRKLGVHNRAQAVARMSQG